MGGPIRIGDLEELVRVLATGATLDDGEPVPLLTHALQCAGRLQATHPRDPELVVAGLVHDIGSVLVPDDPAGHARHGAAAVRGLLGDRVARLVRGHAQAKRYLVATDPAYRAALSHRSVVTLEAQGGTMRPEEIRAFEAAAGDDLDALVALRQADDAAKVPGAPTAPLASWRPLLEQVSSAAGGTA